MFRSLKSKMIVPIIGLVAVGVTVVSVFFSMVTMSRANAFSEERMAAAAQAVCSYLAVLEQQTHIAAAAMSSSGELTRLIQAGVRDDIWQYVFERKVFMGVDEIVVVNHQGTALARSHMRDSFGDDIGADPSVAAALRGEILSFYTPTPTAHMVMTTVSPIFYGAPAPGAVEVHYVVDSAEFLDKIYNTFAIDAMVFMGTTLIASTITDPETGQRAANLAVDPEIVETVISQGQHTYHQMDLFGVPYYAYYFPLYGVDGNPIGMFFLGLSKESAIATVNTAMRNTVIISIVAIVTIAILILSLVTKALKPIKLLTKTLNESAKGDLTKRLPETGKDEITMASRSFNQTMEALGKMIGLVKQQAGTLSEIGNNLAMNMTETAAAMNEITATIQSTKGRILNQSASVTETNATMEQVTININKLSGHVERQTSAVSQASSSLEQVMASIQSVTSTLVKNSKNVKELQEFSETGKNSLQEVADDIQGIARESEGLLEINAVMENIASQTNLLSMNAAIEAAHAGDSGKGFAVVADEIRKLAESSGEQSKTIGDVLKKMKESVDKITRSTDRVLDRFEAIDKGVRTVAKQEEYIRNAMEEQSQGSKQLLEAAGQVGEITRQVKSGSLEMLEGSKEVIHESKNLEKATVEITNGVNEMSTGAEQVNHAVNTVNDLTGRTRENIESLVQAVSKFKV
jgi:methyl-accepting chemotaxis protein